MDSHGREIIISGDGSHTLFVPSLGEHYHSLHGAIQESEHVFIKECLLYSGMKNPVIFEAGFGTGLNALLTLKTAIEENLDITYYSIEKFPLGEEEWSRLNHGEVLSGELATYFRTIHECEWGEIRHIHPSFHLFKIMNDLATFSFSIKPDLVYFDAFSPGVQPELWTESLFGKLYRVMKPGGILTTYSAKGSIRRALSACGFRVEKIKGPPGKREMVRAVR